MGKEKILITGATGELGGLTVEYLLNMKNISKEQVTVMARKQNDTLLNRGIEVRLGSYDDSESLNTAFYGINKLLFISSPCLDNARRLQQQLNVIMAAMKNKIEHIVYVGLAEAEKRLYGLEDVDMATEHMILAVGIPYTFMRNPVYLDELQYDMKVAAKTGRLLSSTKDSVFNYSLKRDLALANATVLSQEGHENEIYDLRNHELTTYSGMAEIVSQITGRTISYEEKTAEEVITHLINADIDDGAADLLVNTFHRLISESQFVDTSNDLRKLLGDSITSKKDAIASLLN